MWSEVTQLSLTLCDPMDYSLPGSSFRGILQARVLEWVVISFSRGSSQPRDWTRVSHIPGRCFNLWATREAHQGLGFIKCLLALWLASITRIFRTAAASHELSPRDMHFCLLGLEPSTVMWPVLAQWWIKTRRKRNKLAAACRHVNEPNRDQKYPDSVTSTPNSNSQTYEINGCF